MGRTVDLRLGSNLWFEGDRWDVVGLDGSDVVLRSGERLQRVALAELAARASPFDADSSIAERSEQSDSIQLAKLPTLLRAKADRRAHVVRRVIAQSVDGTKGAVVEDAARELKVSTRTIRRWVADYEHLGVAGLAGVKTGRPVSARLDPRWDAACARVLARYVNDSTPTRNVVIAEVAHFLELEFGDGVVTLPSQSAAYKRLAELSKGRHAFGSAKSRRSVANRPKGPYGRLRAHRPGEYVVLDTNSLDVFAMEAVTLRWVPVELTVALDLYSRCVLGMRLTPVSTKAADVANVLYQCVAPARLKNRDGAWPFHGVPDSVLVGHEQPEDVLPSCVPETISIDNGRPYVSAHVVHVCERLGINIQPARPYTPTDKPTVERFFRTLREGLLQHLPAYKGPDVYSRGKDVEKRAFLYVSELEQIIREWTGVVYHNTKHDGICVPELPRVALSPAEMFGVGLAKSGGLRLLAKRESAYDFLAVEWRTIQHYGVDVHGLRYDGGALNMYRDSRSPFGGVRNGKWPIFVNVHDVRNVYFQDPETRDWHPLEWEHAPGLDQPFGRDAAEYVKRVAVDTHRHVDPLVAVRELLQAWSREEVTSRRDKNLAKRISSQRVVQHPDVAAGEPQSARDVASLPGVVDLLAHREERETLDVVDDIDVFERYYIENPDGAGLEVFDE